MQNGDIELYYNYELDELFMIKKGVIFGKYMLEDDHGTSKPFKTFEELEASSNLLDNSIFLGEI